LKNPKLRIVLIRNIHGTDKYFGLHYNLFKEVTGYTPDKHARSFAREMDQIQIRVLSDIQGKIQSAISLFDKSYGIREIYSEGNFVEKPEQIKLVSKRLPGKDNLPGSIKNESPSLWKEYDKAISRENNKRARELEKKALEKERFFSEKTLPRAPVMSFQSGVLDNVLATESNKIRDLVEGVNITDKAHEAFHNLREDFTLQLIKVMEKNGDRVAIVLYGGGHDFSDNVEKIGSDIALTVLTPEGYFEGWRYIGNKEHRSRIMAKHVKLREEELSKKK